MITSKYILDSNSLITPYRQYYQFSIAEGFWVNLKKYMENGTIAMLDVVKKEILQGDDELSRWIESINLGNFLTRLDADVIKYYGDILESIQNNNCYTAEALTEWSRAGVADAWLIDKEKKNDLTVVTFEGSNKNLSEKSPSKKAKIPDIANEFGVNCCDLFEMMKAIGMTIGV